MHKGPYIIMHLHSTHEYAQWGVVLLSRDYCRYHRGCMSQCVSKQTSTTPINKSLLSSCQPWRTTAVTMETKCIYASWRLFPYLHVSAAYVCVCSCMGFYQLWHFWLINGKLNLVVCCVMCIFGAIKAYLGDFKNKAEIDNSPAFSVLHIYYLKLRDLFGCFYIGQMEANTCWTPAAET